LGSLTYTSYVSWASGAAAAGRGGCGMRGGGWDGARPCTGQRAERHPPTPLILGGSRRPPGPIEHARRTCSAPWASVPRTAAVDTCDQTRRRCTCIGPLRLVRATQLSSPRGPTHPGRLHAARLGEPCAARPARAARRHRLALGRAASPCARVGRRGAEVTMRRCRDASMGARPAVPGPTPAAIPLPACSIIVGLVSRVYPLAAPRGPKARQPTPNRPAPKQIGK
jgi:hypothetical protein